MITISAADLALLNAGEEASISAAAGPQPFYIFKDGVFNFAGFWHDDGLTINDAYVAPDGTKSLLMTPTQGWENLQAYPPAKPSNPSSNGIGFDTSDYETITISIRPASDGAILRMNAYAVSGSYVGPDAPTVDTMITPPVDMKPEWGPAVMTKGVWNTYKIPKSALAITAWIYKPVAQQANGEPIVWEVNNYGFLP